MNIEILVERDPDAADVITVFVDGVETTEYTEHVVDPGAGHSRHEWDTHTADIEADDTLSPAYRQAVLEARTAAGDSPYIEED